MDTARHPAITHDSNGTLVCGLEDIYINDPVSWERCSFFPGGNYGEYWYMPGEWGVIWYDDFAGNPIKYTYPSLHFNGYTTQGHETCFIGTMVDPPDNWGQSGYTQGGATPIHKIIGDVFDNRSYFLAYWDWHTYGWSGTSAAENAVARYEDPAYEWAWGANAFIMDTTYDGYDIDDGLFIQYQFTEDYYGTVDWYYWENANDTVSCDIIIDQQAHLFWNDSYGEIVLWDDDNFIEYALYTVFDPVNATTGQRGFGLRLDDWEGLSPRYPDSKDSELENPAADALWEWYPMDQNIMYMYPQVEANAGNLLIVMEQHNLSDPENIDLVIWQTSDGWPEHLQQVASISAPGQELRYPELSCVSQNTYIIHFSINDTLYLVVSYDNGVTWSDAYEYYYDAEHPLINEYKTCDIGDKGSISTWIYNNSEGTSLSWKWGYRFNTVKLTGSCSYEGGAPVHSLQSVEIINLNNSHCFTADVSDDEYEATILRDFDIWPGAMLRIIARDDQNMVGVLDYQVTVCDEFTHVITVNILLDTFYRDLKQFPYYPSQYDTGAMVIKQMMDYLMWNNTIYSAPQDYYNEQTFYDNYSGGDVINTSELCGGLNTEINDYANGWIYGYFFSPSAHDQAIDALKTAVIWLDYNISGSNEHRIVDVPKEGHPYHVPVAVPTGGGYDHWMVIRGIHTNRSMWDTSVPGDHELLNGPVAIYGFWINDPSTGGLGENTYVTAEYFNQTYFQQLNVPGDYYNNKYVVITDPPQNRPSQDVSNLQLICTPPIAEFTVEETRLVEIAKRIPMLHLLGQKIYCQQAQEFGDNVLQNDPDYGPLFTDSKVHSITFRGTHCIIDFTNINSNARFMISLDSQTGSPETIRIHS
ncbi:MAG: hypothetical protein V1726_03630 [Methanobacteriota archaeon]